MLNLYTALSRHLENTLNFIEDFFSNYFDRNEKAPVAYLTVSSQELSRQLQALQQTIKFNEAIDFQLEKILVNNFNKFCLREKTSAA